MGIKFDPITRTWTAWYSKRPPGVNQQPVSLRRIHISSEKDAKRVEKELVLEVQKRIESRTVPTWQTLTQDFLQFQRERGHSEKTLYSYQCYYTSYTFDVWATRLINTISRTEVMTLYKSRLGSNSQSNQQYFIKCVRLAFQYAVDCGHLTSNPVPQLKFRVGDKIKKVLNKEQLGLLLNKAREHSHQWYPHWAVAVYTGMRNGELYALTWDKVDFDKNLILVDSSWNSIDGFKPTKSGDDRLVEIAPGLLPVLKELRLQSPGNGFVLPRLPKWDKGEQARELRTFLFALRLPEIRFHDLRASWATLLLGSGVEPAKVMKMGGWKDMKTMMIYFRKAGIDIRGATQCLNLHDPITRVGSLHQFPGLSSQA